MRLFKSQKTRGDRAKTIYKFEFSTPKLTKNTYPHSCLRPKMFFCKPVLLKKKCFMSHLLLVYLLLNKKKKLKGTCSKCTDSIIFARVDISYICQYNE